MEQHTQLYTELLHSFYLKVLKSHPQRTKLYKSFQAVLIEIAKKQITKNPSRKLLRHGSDFSAPEMGRNSCTLASTSKKISNSNTNKPDQLYCHQNFTYVFAFSYIHLLIDVQSQQILHMMDSKAKLLLQANCNKNIIKNQAKWQRSILQWKKIMNLIQHKNVVNWQRILKSAFMIMEQNLISIIIRTILNLNINASTDLEPKAEIFYKVTEQLKVSLLYFVLEIDRIKQRQKYGIKYKNQLKIGYIKYKNVYACYEKMPQQDNKDRNGEIMNEYLLSPKSIYRKTSEKVISLGSNKEIPISERIKAQSRTETYKNSSNTKNRQQNLSSRYPIIEKNLSPRTSKNTWNYALMKRKILMNIQFIHRQFQQNTKYLSKLSYLQSSNNLNSQQEKVNVEDIQSINNTSRVSKK